MGEWYYIPYYFLIYHYGWITYTLLLNAVGLAGGFILPILLAMMQVFGGINLNSFTTGYEKLLWALSLD